MRKAIYILLFILFSIPSSFGQYNSNHIDPSVCKQNKIKSIKVYEQRYRNEKARGRSKLLFHRMYDTTGLLSESTFYGGFLIGEVNQTFGYDKNGNENTKTDYKYDDKNRIIEKQEKESFGGKWYYTYDSLGNQTKIKWYWFGESKPYFYFIDTFEYNEKNKMTRKIRFRSNNAIYFYVTYEYDSIGNLVKEVRYEENKITDIDINQYDNKGNRIKNDHYDKLKNILLAWYNTNYDEKGLIIFENGKLSNENKPYYRKYIYEYYE